MKSQLGKCYFETPRLILPDPLRIITEPGLSAALINKKESSVETLCSSVCSVAESISKEGAEGVKTKKAVSIKQARE